jgi:hypothetical protein
MKFVAGIALELASACGSSEETAISLEGWWFSLNDSIGSATSGAGGVAISLWT